MKRAYKNYDPQGTHTLACNPYHLHCHSEGVMILAAHHWVYSPTRAHSSPSFAGAGYEMSKINAPLSMPLRSRAAIKRGWAVIPNGGKGHSTPLYGRW